MAKMQANSFEFIYIADKNWRTRARSHLTRNQRHRSRAKKRSLANTIAHCPLSVKRPDTPPWDSQKLSKDSHDFTDKLAPTCISPWTLCDPSQAAFLPPEFSGRFERTAMDYCVAGLGYHNYKFAVRSFPFNALLHEAMADPASLHLLIAKTGYHLNTVRQLSSPDTSSSADLEPSGVLLHKSQGIQMVHERIASTSGKPDPTTIQAVLYLAELEDRCGYHEAAGVHLTGLQRMVSLYGGFLAFTPYPRLQLQLAWVEITHFAFLESVIIDASDEVVEYNDAQAHFSAILSRSDTTTPRFATSSFLSTILEATPPFSNTASYTESTRLHIQLAVLFFLNLYVTLDCPDAVSLATYSSDVASLMRHYAAPDGDVRGVLMWILMVKATDEQRYDPASGIAALSDPERTYTVLKMLRLARSTSWSLRLALMSALADKLIC